MERFLAFRRSLGRTPALHKQTVTVRGLAFAVFSTDPVEGATPLVCVNGGMLYDHRLLWPALSPLAAGRQVILYDQRGRGASQAPATPAEARIEDDAADLGALRRALGIRRWDVLGHSWGGGIAMLGVAMDQGGTRRLVTVNAVGPTSSWLPTLRANALARTSGESRAVLEAIDDATLAEPDPETHAAHSRAAYPAYFAEPALAEYFTPPRAASVTGAAVAARLRREGYDWTPILRALSVPTLVIHGEEDPLPPAAARDLASLLPQARLALISGAGHMPFWEAPERFFALVDGFLPAPPPGAAQPALSRPKGRLP